MNGKQLNDVLREARMKSGLTAEKLGEEIGVSHVSISHWEGGRRIPGDRQLRRLASIFHLDLNNLLNLAEHHRCHRELNKLKARYQGKFRTVLLETAAHELDE